MVGRRGAAIKARKSYVENDDSEEEVNNKGDDQVSEFTDSDSEEEAPPPPVRTPKAPPKQRLKGAPPPQKIQYKEPDSDESGPDDAELEGSDSDFDVKKATPKKAKPATPASKKKGKSPKKAANGSAKKAGKGKGRPKGKAARNSDSEDNVSVSEDEDEEEYTVQNIMDVRFPKGNKPREFLIRWKGCGEDEDTWEPEDNIYCTDKIQAFMKTHSKKGSNGSSSGKKTVSGRGRPTKPVRYSVDSDDGGSESEEDLPISKRSKKASPMKKSVPRSNLHPPVSEMIPQAIRKLKENPRKGSSLAAIKGFMAEEWEVNIKQINTKIKNFIINAVEDGEVIRKSGSGVSGRFTLPGMKFKPKKKKKKIIKSDEEDNGQEEGEYKPIKRARDEDREREEKEKEERRLQRQEIEYKMAIAKEAERAAMPKKPVQKKEEYEVEYVKAKKEVGDVLYYQVKYKDYKKMWWEPEENLTGCTDLIQNFYLEEKVRLAELEERKKALEEGGEFEVHRILEVKFPKGKPREFLIRWKGCKEDDDTWEPESNLNCDEKIEKFMLEHEKRMNVSEKSLREAPKKVSKLNYTSNKRHKGRDGFRKTYEDMDYDYDY